MKSYNRESRGDACGYDRDVYGDRRQCSRGRCDRRGRDDRSYRDRSRSYIRHESNGRDRYTEGRDDRQAGRERFDRRDRERHDGGDRERDLRRDSDRDRDRGDGGDMSRDAYDRRERQSPDPRDNGHIGDRGGYRDRRDDRTVHRGSDRDRLDNRGGDDGRRRNDQGDDQRGDRRDDHRTTSAYGGSGPQRSRSRSPARLPPDDLQSLHGVRNGGAGGGRFSPGRGGGYRQSRSRSATSRSPEWRRARGPTETKVEGGDGHVDEDVVVEIVDGITRVSGEKTYQAQAYAPRPGVSFQSVGSANKMPTVCIRGPSRVDKMTAEDDAAKMKQGYHDGGIVQLRRVRASLTGRGGPEPKSF
eukprot:TRINITY_DN10443_c0_g1_i2.p1 TRINITY_DN10443_c0_g1~~TRINITY_DN10443_c0_g1_i2.p1  ORF type:complete len:358 (-),score=43.33 TRINITY_DN10443_c0_g1_i2:219-1292(-)